MKFRKYILNKLNIIQKYYKNQFMDEDNKRNKIYEIINHVKDKHPEYFDSTKNLNVYNVQFGGDLESNKLRKMQELLSYYIESRKKIGDMRDNMGKIDSTIDEINNKIKNISDLDDIDIDEEQIQNFMDDINTSFDRNTQTFSVNNNTNNREFIPPIEDRLNYKSINQHKRFIEEIKEQYERLKNTVNTNEDYVKEIVELNRIINESRDKIKREKDNISEQRDRVIKILESIDLNTLLYAKISKDDIKIADKFDISKINSFIKFALEYQIRDNEEITNDKLNNIKEIITNVKDYIENEDNNINDKIKRINIYFSDNSVKKLIEKYNDTTQHKITIPIFDNSFEIRINNKLVFKDDIESTGQTEELNNLNTNFGELRDIYDKSKLEQIFVDMDSGQTGGNIIENENELVRNILLYNREIKDIESDFYKTNNIISEINMKYSHYIKFLKYMVLITTNKLIADSYSVYVYINRGIIMLYRRTIKEILSKINSKSRRGEIVFFEKNYYYVLLYLNNFLDKIFKLIRIEDIIDIVNSKSNVKKGFTILNHFKLILDIYRDYFQQQVTIYARINDWGDQTTDRKVFESYMEKQRREEKETSNNTTLLINKGNCNEHDNDKDSFIFTEVFDSTFFIDNSSIASYMNIHTQLSQGKGVVKMTYGYSGVGKTHTLFGKTGEIKGLLQSTIEKINGLKSFGLKIFELHGTAYPYSFYWNVNPENETEANSIDQRLFYYIISSTQDGTLKIPDGNNVTEEINEFSKMKKYINDDSENSYRYIDQHQIKTTIDNFNDLIESIDNHRKKNKRIIETPNNPESSRSILVYDFKLRIDIDGEEKDVPFIIIDLPGREEISETYVDEYFKKPVVQRALMGNLRFSYEQINLKQLKINDRGEYRFNDDRDGIIGNQDFKKFMEYQLMLLAMTVNPYYVAILRPNIIVDIFNKQDKRIREKILTSEIKFEGNDLNLISGDCPTNIEESMINEELRTSHNIEKESYRREKLSDYCKAERGKQIDRALLGHFIDFNLGIEKGNDQYKIVSDRRNNDSVFTWRIPPKIDSGKHIFSKGARFFDSIPALHLINRIIRTGHFDIMSEIIEKLAEEINNKIDNYINGLNEKELSEFGHENEKEELKRKNRFTYYSTPREGIFINETLNGMIEYLAQFNESKEDSYIPIQEVDTFNETQFKIRKEFNVDLYRVPSQQMGVQSGGAVNYIPQVEGFKKAFDRISSYSSDKLFTQDIGKMLITNLFDRYFQPKKEKKDRDIKDFKLFYIFTNNDKELKCGPQLQLLYNTENFIKSLTKTEKTMKEEIDDQD